MVMSVRAVSVKTWDQWQNVIVACRDKANHKLYPSQITVSSHQRKSQHGDKPDATTPTLDDFAPQISDVHVGGIHCEDIGVRAKQPTVYRGSRDSAMHLDVDLTGLTDELHEPMVVNVFGSNGVIMCRLCRPWLEDRIGQCELFSLSGTRRASFRMS